MKKGYQIKHRLLKIMKNCLIGIPTDNLLQPMANFTIINIVNN